MPAVHSRINCYRIVLLALFIFIFLPITTSAQTGGNVLQGRVFAPDGTQPNAPVRVRLTYNGRLILETFTDLSGRFEFPGIQAGRYVITAEGDGLAFETTAVTTDVTGFGSSPQSYTQDVHLRPIVNKGIPPPGVVNAFNQDVPHAARQSFEQGMKLADSGKREEAIAKMREAIVAFPKYFDAHLQLGNLFLKTGKAAEAIAELDIAREINPNDERTFQSFGLLMLNQRNYPVAVAVFEEAGRLNPSNAMNPLMRGIALIHQAATVDESNTAERLPLLGQADRALAHALNLSDNKMKPDAPTLALFYEMKGEPERAATELEGFLKKAPDARNAEALKTEIKRLRDKAQAHATKP